MWWWNSDDDDGGGDDESDEWCFKNFNAQKINFINAHCKYGH